MTTETDRAAILAAIEERATAERVVCMRAFAESYLRRLSPDATDGATAAELACEAIGAFEFANSRGQAPIAVRAFQPTHAQHGYEPHGTVVETNTADMPFLVDSVSEELRARGLGVRRVLHPISGIERDADGKILRVLPAPRAKARESTMHFELHRRLSASEAADLEVAIRRVLADVRRAVSDFGPMLDRVESIVALIRTAAPNGYSTDDVEEAASFLHWLRAGNFTFLGYREYALEAGNLRVLPHTGLGILHDPRTSSLGQPRPLSMLKPDVRARVESRELIRIAKTNHLAPVHRRARMDYIGIRTLANDGSTLGEAGLLGLFTTKAYVAPAEDTPLVATKLRRIVELEELIEGSHDYKAAVALLASFPKDELLAASIGELRRSVVELLEMRPEQVRLLGRRDPSGRAVSLIVSMSRKRYDSVLVVEGLLALFRERFAASSIDHHVVLEDPERVLMHFAVQPGLEASDEISLEELEREAIARTRTWDERLHDHLTERPDMSAEVELARRWAPRLPESYKARTDPKRAIEDIVCLERLARGEQPIVRLWSDPSSGGVRARIALYNADRKAKLSEFLPILEHLGLVVDEEMPTHVAGDRDMFIQDFGVAGPEGEPLDVDRLSAPVGDCISSALRGDTESDSLHRLVILAGLTWRQVRIMRAYRRYRELVGTSHSNEYQSDAFALNPRIVAKLVRYFELQFDPTMPRDVAAEKALRAEIVADIDEVPSLDQDEILRDQLALIDATVRTNAFAIDRTAFAIKLRSAHVPGIPAPAPLCEIFVYSPTTEGIHLRGGRIARGGVRWSERRDYRTEVFGLMRSQMTKNALIVPTGAKGGFYVKRRDHEQLAEAAERAYTAYISALLDVTDNVVDGETVAPEDVRAYDEHDPYLVVAADKGTAALSDTANAVANERGFWLKDAFASGGATGYDHKRLGITARGAWESVKRHFRELAIDPNRHAFSCVGIGDMSGDVFGNAMLLSSRIRLLAAFDHRHIFIDPDPDPTSSFEERRRLFALSGSSWNDYDRAQISSGGGVWPRGAKRIQLSTEAAQALGVAAGALAPNEVIRAILRAPVDLLFNGGIGTFVKGSHEQHDEAQDRSNDALRVDAADLRCRVTVEGGNLGFTQQARLEYAKAGGRIFADFIDNSAGVDLSDREVNLKILLGVAQQRGKLDESERVQILEGVSEQIVARVLRDNFRQTRILAREAVRSAASLWSYEHLMNALEEAGSLTRRDEGLPSTSEMLERRQRGDGMERPELAVLLACAKNSLKGALMGSSLLDDPWLDRDLHAYFPQRVTQRFCELLGDHPLRRELLATINANLVIDGLGPAFVVSLARETGAELSEVVAAYRVAHAVTDAQARWSRIHRLDAATVDYKITGPLMDAADRLIEAVTRWQIAQGPTADLDAAVRAGRTAFAEQLDGASFAMENEEPDESTPCWPVGAVA